MNDVKLIGTLGRDPEAKKLGSGDMMTTFSIAMNEKNHKTGETFTTWQKIISFRHVAERASALRKGDTVFINGKIQTRKWEDKLITEVAAYVVEKIERYTKTKKSPIGTPIKVPMDNNSTGSEFDDLPF